MNPSSIEGYITDFKREGINMLENVWCMFTHTSPTPSSRNSHVLQDNPKVKMSN